MPILLKCFLVFLMMAVGDFIWAAYVNHIAKGNIVRASLYAAGNALFGGLIVIAYIDNKLMIIPSMIGAFIGTYLSLKYKRH